MAIRYIEKDITTVQQGIIVHGCNCQGAMGAGVALFLKNKYPEIFPRYAALCKAAKNNPDELLGDIDVVNVARNLFIVNGFTQHLYLKDGRLAHPNAIRDVFASTFMLAALLKQDVYMPKIGCGRGGLNWDQDVEPILNNFVTTCGSDIYVCSWKE